MDHTLLLSTRVHCFPLKQAVVVKAKAVVVAKAKAAIVAKAKAAKARAAALHEQVAKAEAVAAQQSTKSAGFMQGFLAGCSTSTTCPASCAMYPQLKIKLHCTCTPYVHAPARPLTFCCSAVRAKLSFPLVGFS